MGRPSPLSAGVFTVSLMLLVAGTSQINAAPVQETSMSRYTNQKGCYYMNELYPSGEKIQTNEPCLNCTCVDSTLMCYLRVCPFVKPVGEHCMSEMHVGDCCPKFWCPEVYPRITTEKPETEPRGCFLEGRYYDEGARIPMDPLKPCEVCYCIRNTSVCTMQECELKVDGCFPQYKAGSCCPARYNCTDEAATTIPPGVMEPEDYEGCRVGDKLYHDGDPVPSKNKCETCFCMKHAVACAVQKCTAPADSCVPGEVEPGQCCPTKYECPLTTEVPVWHSTLAPFGEDSTSNVSLTTVIEHEVTATESSTFDVSIQARTQVTEQDSETSSVIVSTLKPFETSTNASVLEDETLGKVTDIPGVVETLISTVEPKVTDTSNVTRITEFTTASEATEVSGATVTSGATETSSAESETTRGVVTVESTTLSELTETPSEVNVTVTTSDLVSRSREPKITEVPEDFYTSSTTRPVFFPSRPIPGEGTCRHENRTFQPKEKVASLDPCRKNCMCVNSVWQCEIFMECIVAPRKNCKRVPPTEGECCPTYVCEEETTIATSTTLKEDFKTLAAAVKPTTTEIEKVTDTGATTLGIQEEVSLDAEDFTVSPTKHSQETFDTEKITSVGIEQKIQDTTSEQLTTTEISVKASTEEQTIVTAEQVTVAEEDVVVTHLSTSQPLSSEKPEEETDSETTASTPIEVKVIDHKEEETTTTERSTGFVTEKLTPTASVLTFETKEPTKSTEEVTETQFTTPAITSTSAKLTTETFTPDSSTTTERISELVSTEDKETTLLDDSELLETKTTIKTTIREDEHDRVTLAFEAATTEESLTHSTEIFAKETTTEELISTFKPTTESTLVTKAISEITEGELIEKITEETELTSVDKTVPSTDDVQTTTTDDSLKSTQIEIKVTTSKSVITTDSSPLDDQEPDKTTLSTKHSQTDVVTMADIKTSTDEYSTTALPETSHSDETTHFQDTEGSSISQTVKITTESIVTKEEVEEKTFTDVSKEISETPPTELKFIVTESSDSTVTSKPIDTFGIEDKESSTLKEESVDVTEFKHTSHATTEDIDLVTESVTSSVPIKIKESETDTSFTTLKPTTEIQFAETTVVSHKETVSTQKEELETKTTTEKEETTFVITDADLELETSKPIIDTDVPKTTTIDTDVPKTTTIDTDVHKTTTIDSKTTVTTIKTSLPEEEKATSFTIADEKTDESTLIPKVDVSETITPDEKLSTASQVPVTQTSSETSEIDKATETTTHYSITSTTKIPEIVSTTLKSETTHILDISVTTETPVEKTDSSKETEIITEGISVEEKVIGTSDFTTEPDAFTSSFEALTETTKSSSVEGSLATLETVGHESEVPSSLSTMDSETTTDSSTLHTFLSTQETTTPVPKESELTEETIISKEATIQITEKSTPDVIHLTTLPTVSEHTATFEIRVTEKDDKITSESETVSDGKTEFHISSTTVPTTERTTETVKNVTSELEVTTLEEDFTVVTVTDSSPKRGFEVASLNRTEVGETDVALETKLTEPTQTSADEISSPLPLQTEQSTDSSTTSITTTTDSIRTDEIPKAVSTIVEDTVSVLTESSTIIKEADAIDISTVSYITTSELTESPATTGISIEQMSSTQTSTRMEEKESTDSITTLLDVGVKSTPQLVEKTTVSAIESSTFKPKDATEIISTSTDIPRTGEVEALTEAGITTPTKLSIDQEETTSTHMEKTTSSLEDKEQTEEIKDTTGVDSILPRIPFSTSSPETEKSTTQGTVTEIMESESSKTPESLTDKTTLEGSSTFGITTVPSTKLETVTPLTDIFDKVTEEKSTTYEKFSTIAEDMLTSTLSGVFSDAEMNETIAEFTPSEESKIPETLRAQTKLPTDSHEEITESLKSTMQDLDRTELSIQKITSTSSTILDISETTEEFKSSAHTTDFTTEKGITLEETVSTLKKDIPKSITDSIEEKTATITHRIQLETTTAVTKHADEEAQTPVFESTRVEEKTVVTDFTTYNVSDATKTLDETSSVKFTTEDDSEMLSTTESEPITEMKAEKPEILSTHILESDDTTLISDITSTEEALSIETSPFSESSEKLETDGTITESTSLSQATTLKIKTTDVSKLEAESTTAQISTIADGIAKKTTLVEDITESDKITETKSTAATLIETTQLTTKSATLTDVELDEESSTEIADSTEVSQEITTKGTIITNITTELDSLEAEITSEHSTFGITEESKTSTELDTFTPGEIKVTEITQEQDTINRTITVSHQEVLVSSTPKISTEFEHTEKIIDTTELQKETTTSSKLSETDLTTPEIISIDKTSPEATSLFSTFEAETSTFPETSTLVEIAKSSIMPQFISTVTSTTTTKELFEPKLELTSLKDIEISEESLEDKTEMTSGPSELFESTSSSTIETSTKVTDSTTTKPIQTTSSTTTHQEIASDFTESTIEISTESSISEITDFKQGLDETPEDIATETFESDEKLTTPKPTSHVTKSSSGIETTSYDTISTESQTMESTESSSLSSEHFVPKDTLPTTTKLEEPFTTDSSKEAQSDITEEVITPAATTVAEEKTTEAEEFSKSTIGTAKEDIEVNLLIKTTVTPKIPDTTTISKITSEKEEIFTPTVRDAELSTLTSEKVAEHETSKTTIGLKLETTTHSAIIDDTEKHTTLEETTKISTTTNILGLTEVSIVSEEVIMSNATFEIDSMVISHSTTIAPITTTKIGEESITDQGATILQTTSEIDATSEPDKIDIDRKGLKEESTPLEKVTTDEIVKTTAETTPLPVKDITPSKTLTTIESEEIHDGTKETTVVTAISKKTPLETTPQEQTTESTVTKSPTTLSTTKETFLSTEETHDAEDISITEHPSTHFDVTEEKDEIATIAESVSTGAPTITKIELSSITTTEDIEISSKVTTESQKESETISTHQTDSTTIEISVHDHSTTESSSTIKLEDITVPTEKPATEVTELPSRTVATSTTEEISVSPIILTTNVSTQKIELVDETVRISTEMSTIIASTQPLLTAVPEESTFMEETSEPKTTEEPGFKTVSISTHTQEAEAEESTQPTTKEYQTEEPKLSTVLADKAEEPKMSTTQEVSPEELKQLTTAADVEESTQQPTTQAATTDEPKQSTIEEVKTDEPRLSTTQEVEMKESKLSTTTTREEHELTTQSAETEEPKHSTTEESETEESKQSTTGETETVEPKLSTTIKAEVEEHESTTQSSQTEEPKQSTMKEAEKEEPTQSTTEEAKQSTAEEAEKEEPTQSTTEEVKQSTTEEAETEEPKLTTAQAVEAEKSGLSTTQTSEEEEPKQSTTEKSILSTTQISEVEETKLSTTTRAEVEELMRGSTEQPVQTEEAKQSTEIVSETDTVLTTKTLDKTLEDEIALKQITTTSAVSNETTIASDITEFVLTTEKTDIPSILGKKLPEATQSTKIASTTALFFEEKDQSTMEAETSTYTVRPSTMSQTSEISAIITQEDSTNAEPSAETPDADFTSTPEATVTSMFIEKTEPTESSEEKEPSSLGIEEVKESTNVTVEKQEETTEPVVVKASSTTTTKDIITTEPISAVTESTSSTATTTTESVTETGSDILEAELTTHQESFEKTTTQEAEVTETIEAETVKKDECSVNGTLYRSGQPIQTVEPCEKCHCALGEIVCFKIICKLPMKGCIAETFFADECCPSTYRCPADDGSLSTIPFVDVQSTTEKDFTTPIPISFMFSTTPTAIQSTTLITKSDDKTPTVTDDLITEHTKEPPFTLEEGEVSTKTTESSQIPDISSTLFDDTVTAIEEKPEVVSFVSEKRPTSTESPFVTESKLTTTLELISETGIVDDRSTDVKDISSTLSEDITKEASESIKTDTEAHLTTSALDTSTFKEEELISTSESAETSTPSVSLVTDKVITTIASIDVVKTDLTTDQISTTSFLVSTEPASQAEEFSKTELERTTTFLPPITLSEEMKTTFEVTPSTKSSETIEQSTVTGGYGDINTSTVTTQSAETTVSEKAIDEITDEDTTKSAETTADTFTPAKLPKLEDTITSTMKSTPEESTTEKQEPIFTPTKLSAFTTDKEIKTTTVEESTISTFVEKETEAVVTIAKTDLDEPIITSKRPETTQQDFVSQTTTIADAKSTSVELSSESSTLSEIFTTEMKTQVSDEVSVFKTTNVPLESTTFKISTDSEIKDTPTTESRPEESSKKVTETPSETTTLEILSSVRPETSQETITEIAKTIQTISSLETSTLTIDLEALTDKEDKTSITTEGTKTEGEAESTESFESITETIESKGTISSLSKEGTTLSEIEIKTEATEADISTVTLEDKPTSSKEEPDSILSKTMVSLDETKPTDTVFRFVSTRFTDKEKETTLSEDSRKTTLSTPTQVTTLITKDVLTTKGPSIKSLDTESPFMMQSTITQEETTHEELFSQPATTPESPKTTEKQFAVEETTRVQNETETTKFDISEGVTQEDSSEVFSTQEPDILIDTSTLLPSTTESAKLLKSSTEIESFTTLESKATTKKDEDSISTTADKITSITTQEPVTETETTYIDKLLVTGDLKLSSTSSSTSTSLDTTTQLQETTTKGKTALPADRSTDKEMLPKSISVTEDTVAQSIETTSKAFDAETTTFSYKEDLSLTTFEAQLDEKDASQPESVSSVVTDAVKVSTEFVSSSERTAFTTSTEVISDALSTIDTPTTIESSESPVSTILPTTLTELSTEENQTLETKISKEETSRTVEETSQMTTSEVKIITDKFTTSSLEEEIVSTIPSIQVTADTKAETTSSSVSPTEKDLPIALGPTKVEFTTEVVFNITESETTSELSTVKVTELSTEKDAKSATEKSTDASTEESTTIDRVTVASTVIFSEASTERGAEVSTEKFIEVALTERATETPREISTVTPTEIATETPKEISTETPKEISTESPKEISTETPKEIFTETPKEISTESPKEISTETPKEISTETPKEISTETPKEISTETPKEISTETPKEISTETSAEDIITESLTEEITETRTHATSEDSTVNATEAITEKVTTLSTSVSNITDTVAEKSNEGITEKTVTQSTIDSTTKRDTEIPTKAYKAIETTPTALTTESTVTENVTTTDAEDDFLLDEGVCIFEGQIYHSAEQILRSDPCEFCFCFRGDIICLQQSCPPPAPNCHSTMIPGYCCPRYDCPVLVTSRNMTNFTRRKGVQPIIIQKRIEKRAVRAAVEVKGCQIDGKFYPVGSSVSKASGPCLHCACEEGGNMRCDPIKCKPEAPLMLKMNNHFFRNR